MKKNFKKRGVSCILSGLIKQNHPQTFQQDSDPGSKSNHSTHDRCRSEKKEGGTLLSMIPLTL
jgi:hypothetical protein